MKQEPAVEHTTRRKIEELQSVSRTMLTDQIAPFWLDVALDPDGGMHGAIDDRNRPVPDRSRGLVAQARHCWFFAALHRTTGSQRARTAALHCADYLQQRFTDPLHGGYYWSVDAYGKPTDSTKVIYGQVFALYALSELFRSTADERFLHSADRLYGLLATRAWDSRAGGFWEAVAEDWSAPIVHRLSDQDVPCDKSMNTNLHALEALTTFVLAGGPAHDLLQRQLAVMAHKVFDGKQLGIYFDATWEPLGRDRSYGHDIEAAWLLNEAAQVAGDRTMSSTIGSVSDTLVAATHRNAYHSNGGVVSEVHADGTHNDLRIWWVQAEAAVGFCDAWQRSGRSDYLDAAIAALAFVANHMSHPRGEFWSSVTADGAPAPTLERAGPWKTGYHLGRACMELSRRAQQTTAAAGGHGTHLAHQGG